ncbi:MAG: type I 3-dehydroquinate dehydratase [Acidobacteriota bacterium]
MNSSSHNPASLVASFASIPRQETLARLPPSVDWVEVRGLGVPPSTSDGWRSSFQGRLLFALPRREPPSPDSADSGLSPSERRQRLAAAAQAFDLVELDAERDLDPRLLAKIPPAQRLIAWHGPPVDFAELEQRFTELAETPARLYKLVPEARTAAEGLAPLVLLRHLGRRDVIAFASGAGGFWTRLIAPRLGYPMVFARAEANGQRCQSPDQPVLRQLADDYGLPALPRADKLCGIVGCGVSRSLSPRLHNAAYRELGLSALYLPFEAECFPAFWRHLATSDTLNDLGLPLAGLTVVAPHKEAACVDATPCSEFVRRAGAANLLHRPGSAAWLADSTDAQGVLDPLTQRNIDIRGQKAAVIGCGGAGRTIAAGLHQAGAKVALVNRSVERGRRTARRLGLPFRPLAEFDARGFALVVHATPLGRVAEDATPFEVSRLDRDAVVVDLIYADQPTTLVTAARHRRVQVIDGREVLLAQTRRQLHAMTGKSLSLQQLRRFLDQPSH